MSRNTSRARAVALVIGLTALTGALAAGVPSLSGSATFEILNRPQSLADTVAIQEYRGEPIPQLATARLAGTDGSGRRYFVAQNDEEVCLIIVTSPESASGSCDSSNGAATGRLWNKFGDDSTSHLAMVVPDGFFEATLTGVEQPTLRTNNLVVVPAKRGVAQTAVFHGALGRTITVATGS